MDGSVRFHACCFCRVGEGRELAAPGKTVGKTTKAGPASSPEDELF